MRRTNDAAAAGDMCLLAAQSAYEMRIREFWKIDVMVVTGNAIIVAFRDTPKSNIY